MLRTDLIHVFFNTNQRYRLWTLFCLQFDFVIRVFHDIYLFIFLFLISWILFYSLHSISFIFNVSFVLDWFYLFCFRPKYCLLKYFVLVCIRNIAYHRDHFTFIDFWSFVVIWDQKCLLFTLENYIYICISVVYVFFMSTKLIELDNKDEWQRENNQNRKKNWVKEIKSKRIKSSTYTVLFRIIASKMAFFTKDKELTINWHLIWKHSNYNINYGVNTLSETQWNVKLVQINSIFFLFHRYICVMYI